MGLFNKIRNEFIDIVEWPDGAPEVLVHRFERYENAIKYGAKLVVRPGQRAVFVNEGKIADVFEPGTYTLETKNLPILRTLQSWAYAFESPFKAEVFFIRTTEMLDRKWGTPNPVMLRDPDFGIVRLRCRGNYTYQLGTGGELITRFVGARGDFSVEDLEGQLRTKVVSAFSDAIGELKIAALDLAAQYDEISIRMKAKLTPDFEGMGIELKSFTLENISLPDDVQQAMDQRASMGAIGNMQTFAQYQSANALRDAAANPGGAGNMMGMMVGGQLAAGLGNVGAAPAAVPPPLPTSGNYFAAIGGVQSGPFPLSDLQARIRAGQITPQTLVWKEGMAGWLPAGQVAELTAWFGAQPPPLPPQS